MPGTDFTNWNVILGLVGSGAVGSGGTLLAVFTAQAVQKSKIEQNAKDIARLDAKIEKATDSMHEATLGLHKAIARLEAIK